MLPVDWKPGCGLLDDFQNTVRRVRPARSPQAAIESLADFIIEILLVVQPKAFINP